MVYHGPSAGCKACRTRRVKCDEGKPACNNCVRRKNVCPGYADVFDGAHRSQNKIVARRLERRLAASETPSSTSTPNSESSLDWAHSTSNTPTALVVGQPAGDLHWINHPASTDDPNEDNKDSMSLTRVNSSNREDCDEGIIQIIMPELLKPDPQEASINFFFRHYTGTIYDPQLHSSFALLWQPLYLGSALNSPLRLATAAVTVNITMMWNVRGCDTRPARQLFTQALAATRKAIDNADSKELDELLMTIIIFDLYDALVLHYVADPVTPYGKHKSGALALLKHRGQLNYSSFYGPSLINAARHMFLDYSLATRFSLPPGAEEIFGHPTTVSDKASQLDALTMEIINVQATLWTLRRQSPMLLSSHDRIKTYEDIIAEAIRIDEALAAWNRSISLRTWLPVYVPREEVAPSILAAGFYGDKCALFVDVVSVDMWDTWLSRRLSTVQMIRQSLADEATLLAQPKYRAYLAKANATVQSSVDAILETIPGCMGDIVVVTNPIYSSQITFPHTIVTDPFTGETRSVPDLEGSSYKSRTAAGGGWMIFPHIVELYRLAEPEDDAEPLILREGQLDWIKGQIKRLQKTFLFCEPVWFKRGRGRPSYSKDRLLTT